MSLSTTFSHVIFGLPLPLLPSTVISILFFTQSVPFFLNTCPIHLSLLCLITSLIFFNAHTLPQLNICLLLSQWHSTHPSHHSHFSSLKFCFLLSIHLRNSPSGTPQPVPSLDKGGGLASGRASGHKNFCLIILMTLHQLTCIKFKTKIQQVNIHKIKCRLIELAVTTVWEFPFYESGYFETVVKCAHCWLCRCAYIETMAGTAPEVCVEFLCLFINDCDQF